MFAARRSFSCIQAAGVALLILLGPGSSVSSARTAPTPALPVHGRVDGPTTHYDRVAAYRSDVYWVRFRGGEFAAINVSGDATTDLDLYVYDANGNLIEFDEDATDECLVSWTPRWTGSFRVVIVNRGPVYNDYMLRTN